jgi:hypothetical protein
MPVHDSAHWRVREGRVLPCCCPDVVRFVFAVSSPAWKDSKQQMTHIQRLTNFVAQYDLVYRSLALVPILLGVSILASFEVSDTTMFWVYINYGISREFYAVVSLICGLRLFWRPVNRYDFILLYLPVWLYQVALVGFVIATHRSATVPALLIAFDLIILAIIRWGMKPL